MGLSGFITKINNYDTNSNSNTSYLFTYKKNLLNYIKKNKMSKFRDEENKNIK